MKKAALYPTSQPLFSATSAAAVSLRQAAMRRSPHPLGGQNGQFVPRPTRLDEQLPGDGDQLAEPFPGAALSLGQLAVVVNVGHHLFEVALLLDPLLLRPLKHRQPLLEGHGSHQADAVG
jgi:hypothetical protein